jgi:hypothetical protein
MVNEYGALLKYYLVPQNTLLRVTPDPVPLSQYDSHINRPGTESGPTR